MRQCAICTGSFHVGEIHGGGGAHLMVGTWPGEDDILLFCACCMRDKWIQRAELRA
jgi:hypothetical protein